MTLVLICRATKLRRKRARAGRVKISVIRIMWRGVPLLYLKRLNNVRVSFHWNSWPSCSVFFVLIAIMARLRCLLEGWLTSYGRVNLGFARGWRGRM